MGKLAGVLGLFAFLVLAFPTEARLPDLEDVTDFEAEALRGRQKILVGELKPTFYWIALETLNDNPKDKALYDRDGNLMVMVGKKFFAGLSMEGTGRLLNGKVLNFHVRHQNPDGSKEVRWRWCDPAIAPFGYGLDDRVLKPFKSIAVDPTVIPMDSKVYIPDAVGAKLPDGTTHNGYFDAIDIGSAIVNQRIDIFTSFGDQSKVFTDNGMQSMKAVKIYLVK